MKDEESEFEKEFEKKVIETIENYNLFGRNDKVLVACSGGKDSTSILYILQKHGYNTEAITIDALIGNYTKENLQNLRNLCRHLNVKLHEISFRQKFGRSLCYIKSMLKSKGIHLSSCTICGVLRRYLINKEARRIKPKCVVTGHNMDDEAQSIIMNMVKNRLELSARLGPKTGLVNDRMLVPRVKPLYFCREDDVIKYSKLKKFNVNYRPCPCRTDSFRRKISDILDELEKKNPQIKENIIKNFLKMLPRLKEEFSTNEKIEYCRSCGEPSKGKICKTCHIISLIGK